MLDTCSTGTSTHTSYLCHFSGSKGKAVRSVGVVDIRAQVLYHNILRIFEHSRVTALHFKIILKLT